MAQKKDKGCHQKHHEICKDEDGKIRRCACGGLIVFEYEYVTFPMVVNAESDQSEPEQAIVAGSHVRFCENCELLYKL